MKPIFALVGVAAITIVVWGGWRFLSGPGATRSTLVATDATTGRELWRTRPDVTVLGAPQVQGGVVTVDGTYAVSVCGFESRTLTFDATSGRQLSLEESAANNGSPVPPAETHVADGSVTAGGGRVFVATKDKVVAMDDGGKELWNAVCLIRLSGHRTDGAVVYIAGPGRYAERCDG